MLGIMGGKMKYFFLNSVKKNSKDKNVKSPIKSSKHL